MGWSGWGELKHAEPFDLAHVVASQKNVLGLDVSVENLWNKSKETKKNTKSNQQLNATIGNMQRGMQRG